MCSDSSSDSSVESSVSDSTAEVSDSTTELYDDSEASQELVHVDATESAEEAESAAEEVEITAENPDNQSEVENTQLKPDVEENSDVEQTESTDTTDDSQEAADYEAVRAEINEKSEYSDEVNDNIASVEELEVYQGANLKEESVDGKTCLVRDDIDWEQKDEFGRTNKQRVEDYDLVPYNKDGKKIELHHIGQKDDSPLAELTFDEHRSKNVDSILHDKQKDSEINRPGFDKVRDAHWKSRVK